MAMAMAVAIDVQAVNPTFPHNRSPGLSPGQIRSRTLFAGRISGDNMMDGNVIREGHAP